MTMYSNVLVLYLQYLKNALLKQPCERLLANPTRQLLHEGQLTLVGKLMLYLLYDIVFP